MDIHFWGTDCNENRAHIHVGKRDTKKMCKIWLEPKVEVCNTGSLTDKQINDIVEITSKYRKELISQWNIFKKGNKVTTIKIKE